MLIVNLIISILLQSGSVAKKNGEIVQLSNISIYQKQDVKTMSLTFSKGNQTKTIEVSKLKRINIKGTVSKSKGVTKWLAILVERDNTKHEVEIELHQIRGVNAAGESFSISANSVDKISF